MNRYFLAFLILATAFEFHARELTPDEALQRVQSASTRMNAPRRIAASAPKLVYTVKSTLDDRDATAYLFANSGKEKGYLLLSAEDTFEPVIGYSNTASITNPDDMPDNLKWWLSEVGREADYAIRHNAVLKAPASLGPAVEPLLKSKWDQDAPFNLYTPEINGQHAPTGCGATAMAQVMYYHQWPPRPQGSHTYEDAWSGGIIRSINFDELQFDWDKMTDTYDYDSSQESKEAVAMLMKAVGYGASMWYALGGSGTDNDRICQAFKDYFLYNKNAVSLSRQSTNFEDWSCGIYSNLSEGMPVIYNGSPADGAGHIFVCDGYDGSGYFHFNWGWGGSMDGYFLISNLVPTSVFVPDGYNYNYYHNVILNLYPENGNDYNSYLFLRGDLWDIYPNGIYDGNGNVLGNVSLFIENVCDLTNIEMGLGIKALNEDGLKIISLEFGNEWTGNTGSGMAMAANLLDYLDRNKEYECQLYWRNSPNMSWTKVWHGLEIGYVYTLKYSNGQWQYIKDLNQADTRLEITDAIINSDNVISNVANNELSFNVQNVADIHVNTQFKVVFENREHFTEYYNYNIYEHEISLEPGESKEYRIDNIPNLKQGNYKVHILDKESGRSFYNSGCDSVKVVEYPEIEADGLIYAIRPNGELFIKGTSTGYPVGSGEIYLPAELTINSQKHKVVDVNFKNIVTKWSECSLIIDTPIEEIKEEQFTGLFSLKKVRLPQTIKKISKLAFSGCSQLSEINFPEGLKIIDNNAFTGCAKLSGDLVIPNSVTEIGEYAFQSCTGFDGRLVLGNSIQNIEKYAFSWCPGFTEDLVIPESVKNIGERVFSRSFSQAGDLVINCDASLGEWVFDGCNFKNLVIGDSVTKIGDSMFSGCSFNGNLKLGNSVSRIGRGAFYGFSEFKGELILPPTVTDIADLAFNGCSGFTGDLIIPNSVTSIGESAFFGCSGLSGRLVLGNSIQNIGNYAFYKSPFIGNLIIPNSVTTIGKSAFYQCTGFTGSLVLGKSIQKIDDSAFWGCSGLKDKWVVPDLKELKYVGFVSLLCFDNVICLQEDIPECYVAGAFGFAVVVRVKPGFGNKYRAHENWSGYRIYEFGDANRSETLTVTDAVADANYIIGEDTGYPFDYDCGDINMNGEISIADVTGIIKAVAEYNPAGLDASAMRAPRQTAGTLDVDDFLLNGGTAEVGVRLHSERPVVALQADFFCGEGIEIEDIELSPKLAGSHALMLSRFEDEGIVRTIVYSLDNRVIDTDEELLTLHVSGEGTGKIEAERILASTPEASEYSLEYVGGESISASGVGEIGGAVRIFSADGFIRILNAEGMNVVIYDIAGRKIKAMTADSSEVKYPLQSGLYIVTVGNVNAKIAL